MGQITEARERSPQKIIGKKKQAKKSFKHFKENFQQKGVFSAHAFPSNIEYFGAKGAFRKILGSVSQKRISQNSTKGDPLGRQWVKSLRQESVPPKKL